MKAGLKSLAIVAVAMAFCAVALQPAFGLGPARGKQTVKPKSRVYKAPAKPVVKAKPSGKASTYKKVVAVRKAPKPVPVLIPRTVSSLNQLERVLLDVGREGEVSLSSMPAFTSVWGGEVAGLSNRNELVYYSVDPELQAYARSLISQTQSPHAAIIAMDPRNGRILAIAEKSNTIKELSLHAGFPAASLFKVVTTAAALERTGLGPLSVINFRGGNYTLERWNYIPNARSDKRFMSLSEALGKSVNAVFGRVALKYLNPSILRNYANTFGFNSDIQFDSPLPASMAYIPEGDYELSRTAAGFGQVHISPIHAATIMAGIANHGLLPRPILIDRITSSNGETTYRSNSQSLRRLVKPETAGKLLQMMRYTTTVGTSRKEFNWKNRPVLPGVKVAAKTGTLRGKNPEGLNNWFIAAAPLESPRIAVSVIVVDPRGISTKASHLGRKMIEKFMKS